VSADSAEEPSQFAPRELMRSLAERSAFGAAAAGLVTFVVFVVVAPNFLSGNSITSILAIAAELGIVAVGVTLLMIGGEFDLSVGSVLGLSALSVPLLMSGGLPAILAVMIGFLIAATVGAISGVIVARTLAPSLIVTLGGLFFWRGVVLMLTGGFPVAVKQDDPLFVLFSSEIYGVNVSVFWLIAVVLLGSFLLYRTRLGNWIFATGGNPTAARQMGVPTARVKVTLFVIASCLAALAGMIQMTRFGSVDALRGQGVELVAIAATVIGGTRLQGGAGSVWGTAFGVTTLAMIELGLLLAGIPGYFYQATVGLLLILAVLVNLYIGRGAAR
jgi:ribose/xylose/arabinose/galactoside ABC-type transport system permease subunit